MLDAMGPDDLVALAGCMHVVLAIRFAATCKRIRSAVKASVDARPELLTRRAVVKLASDLQRRFKDEHHRDTVQRELITPEVCHCAFTTTDAETRVTRFHMRISSKYTLKINGVPNTPPFDLVIVDYYTDSNTINIQIRILKRPYAVFVEDVEFATETVGEISHCVPAKFEDGLFVRLMNMDIV
jgi:hypothetical protein